MRPMTPLLLLMLWGCKDSSTETCEDSLRCASDIEAECEGERTALSIPLPSGCDGMALTPHSEERLAGESAVTGAVNP